MKLEIERKFLLKSLPKTDPKQKVEIDQYYLKNSSGIWERARTWNSSNGDSKFIHTIKKNVSKGVNIEDEYDMTLEQFNDFKEKCLTSPSESRFIKKVRHIYPDGNLYWEVDEFDNDYKLIIAEIEIPKKTFKLTIPNFIKEVMLLEVTGMKQFNNRNLSLKISK
jgi:CYTH domain-containing protein